MFENIYIILKRCNLINENTKFSYNETTKCKIYDFNDTLIQRELLLNNILYKELQVELDILREKYSSSYLTCLQKTASTKQKWPLLNLIRQLFLIIGYKMVPIRKSNGYDKETKKKKYIRYFKVEKMLV